MIESDVVLCEDGTEPNECGACGVLVGLPGTSCGICETGLWRCDEGSVVCAGDRGEEALNECGGCEQLRAVLGVPCGTCDTGVFSCDDTDSVLCQGDQGEEALNDCGGCQDLPQGIGNLCGSCGSGRWSCDGQESVICLGDRGEDALNACGSCHVLVGELGEECGPCLLDHFACQDGQTICDGETLCPLGFSCERDNQCEEGHCSNGRCVPEDMAYVQAGDFIMGAPTDEFGWRGEVQHHVTLTRSFLMQRTEVTQALFEEHMLVNLSFFQDCGSDCPAEQLNWFEAVEFANRLSVSQGLEPCYHTEGCASLFGRGYRCSTVRWDDPQCEGFRLPTEAEWEYATRAGTTTATFVGDLPEELTCRMPVLDEYAWHCGISRSSVHPVGQLLPNPLGLHDILGNVGEWCWDWRAGMSEEPVIDPAGPEEGAQRVIRGCSYAGGSSTCRSASRSSGEPVLIGTTAGLRLVRTFIEPNQ